MLKFANIAKLGDTIRAYDFKPMLGREDCFVEGVIKRIDTKLYDAFVIEVTYDSWDEDTEGKQIHGRVGKEILVPFEVSFMEFDARVMNLSR